MSRVVQGGPDNFEDDNEPSEPSPTPEELRRKKEFRELVRLFCEVNTAVNCLKIVREIERLCSELGQGFFVFAYRALFNEAMSSLMRVLDEHGDAFSVWKLDQKTIETLCLERKIDLPRVRGFSKRLKTARDRLQFHIDRRHVEDPDHLWEELNIKYSEMIDVADNLATIISGILCNEHKCPANLSRYDAEDVEPILEQVHRAKLGNFRKR